MRHVVLIVNPFATAVDERRIAAVEETLSRHAEVRTLLTQRRGHATDLAREASDAAAIFVYSGDGGFNEALNGADSVIPLGCIPGGGTSVFPRALGLPRDPVAAAEHLAESFERGRTKTISLGAVNGRRFGFNAGIGFDAELVRRIEGHRSRDGRPGDVAFVATLLKLIGEHRGRFEQKVEVRGHGRASFVFVANADPYTFLSAVPIHVAPAARLESGLDFVAPTEVRPRQLLTLLRYVLTGRGQLDDPRLLTGHDLDQIEVVCDVPLPLQVDGEDLGDVTEAVFEAQRDAVRVLV